MHKYNILNISLYFILVKECYSTCILLNYAYLCISLITQLKIILYKFGYMKYLFYICQRYNH